MYNSLSNTTISFYSDVVHKVTSSITNACNTLNKTSANNDSFSKGYDQGTCEASIFTASAFGVLFYY